MPVQGCVVKWHLSNASLNLFVISGWLDGDAGWLEKPAPDLKPGLSVLLQAFVKITGARRVSHVFVPQFTPSKQQGQISRALIDTFSLAVVTFSTVATGKQTLQLELKLKSKRLWGIQFVWKTSIVQTFLLRKIKHSQCVRWSWDVVLEGSLPEARYTGKQTALTVHCTHV